MVTCIEQRGVLAYIYMEQKSLMSLVKLVNVSEVEK